MDLNEQGTYYDTKSRSNSESKRPEVVTDTDDTHYNVSEKDYGFFRFKPACFQCCNNSIGFLVVYSLFVITASTLSGGLLNINVSALERRFRLTSNQSALIVVGYDIGFCVLTIFVSYFGARSHRPRLVACGAFVFGLGSMFYALPHFISGLYSTGGRRLSLVCFDPSFELDCSEDNDYLGWSVGVFFLGSLLMGFGLTPAFTLGLAYIEDSVSKESAALYLGIGIGTGVANSAALVGPMIGFLGGGILLRDYYVDFEKTTPPTGVSVVDPRWVGAWWVLPLVVMVGCWLLFVPLFGFPKQIPGTAGHRAARESEVHKYGKSNVGTKIGFKNSIKDFPRSFWILLKNPTFVTACIAGCLQALLINGVSAFLAKYIENNFHESLGNAALLSGAVIVPAAVVGSFVGGLVVYKFKWSVVGCLRFAGACMFITACLTPEFLLYCENRRVAGITAPYSSPSNPNATSQLESECNAQCSCQEEFYVASCAQDGLEYFSPCHASCVNVVQQTPSLIFGPCFCPNSTVTIGPCPVNCYTRDISLALVFLTVFATFASVTPALVSTFRVVPNQMRSFAVGVQFIFFRLLGAIPGPILFGAIIDKACLQWQTRQCDGSRGSCWIYSSRDMALGFLIITVVGNFLSAIVYVISAQVYKPSPQTKYDKENVGNGVPMDKQGKDLRMGIDNPSLSNT